MWEILGAVSGVLSLFITILIEWDNITSQSKRLWNIVKIQRKTLISQRELEDTPPTHISESKSAKILLVQVGKGLLEFFKVLMAVFLGGVILPFVLIGFIDIFVTNSTTLGCFIIVFMIGGLFLGGLFLRKRSWAFILVSSLAGFILYVVTIALTRGNTS